MPSIPPSGFERYPSTNATTASTHATLAGFRADNQPATPKELFPMHGAQGFRAIFLLAGANNDTATYRVYGVYYTYGVQGSDGSRPITGTFYRYLGGGTATASATSTTMGGTASATALRACDGLTWTKSGEGTSPKGPMTAYETAYGSAGAGVYNPADDTDPAELVVPHTGWADGIVIEMDPTGTSTEVLCLIART